MTQPSPTRQYLPSEITTAWPGPVRLKSPRMIAPLDIIVLPPRMMFCGPAIVARRDTLFPVSWIAWEPAMVKRWSHSYSLNEFCFGVVYRRFHVCHNVCVTIFCHASSSSPRCQQALWSTRFDPEISAYCLRLFTSSNTTPTFYIVDAISFQFFGLKFRYRRKEIGIHSQWINQHIPWPLDYHLPPLKNIFFGIFGTFCDSGSVHVHSRIKSPHICSSCSDFNRTRILKY